MNVALPDCSNVSLFDHVLCPLASVQLKVRKCFRASRIVLEPVPFEMSFDQNLDKLSGLVVLDQVVGQFLSNYLDSAKPLLPADSGSCAL